jgi:hypothetical protein
VGGEPSIPSIGPTLPTDHELGWFLSHSLVLHPATYAVQTHSARGMCPVPWSVGIIALMKWLLHKCIVICPLPIPPILSPGIYPFDTYRLVMRALQPPHP